MMNATETVVEPAVKRSSFVRRIVNGGEDSIAKLRSMQKCRDDIAAKFASVLNECKAIQAEAETAERDFAQNPTPELARKLCLLRPQSETARDIFSALYKTQGARVADEFNREHAKDLRPTLLKAAKHLLAKAQAEFDSALAHAKTTLSAEGFDTDEIAQSPKVRHAKWGVERCEHVISSIESSAESQLWQHAQTILK